ncbi:hybrid sensor histidine kinase/response regulator [Noviherbaspirillum autotrophicum]|uniref:hybrid sensor histidine kinase/response regulator n=1 Tax=Noviherbaspirillum autotrophicum TaxID=709839 RepID=UPI000694D927|nr:ATP-binding protein [Noviherbaspirillum autotrophicum]
MKTVRGDEKLERVFPGNSKMARRMRAFDWPESALGPAAAWPPGLRSALSIMLGSPHPMLIWWGRELIQFYNDRYAEQMLGTEQPWPLGRSARILLAAAWDEIGLRVQSVIQTGDPACDEELQIILERKGFLEETYHRLDYAPLQEDCGTVSGIACHVVETTQRVLERRRRQTLRDLAACAGHQDSRSEAALQAAGRILAANPHDIPFALIYLVDHDNGGIRLCVAAGLACGASGAAPAFDRDALSAEADGWSIARVMATGRTEVVTRLGRRFGALPGGAWPEPPHTAVVMPIRAAGTGSVAGFLIGGISPRRELDADYHGFYEGIARSLGDLVEQEAPTSYAQPAPALDGPACGADHAQTRSEAAERARIEEALRRSEAQLAFELAAMSRLHDLSSRLLVTSDMQSALREVLDAALLMLGAAMGSIQLYQPAARMLEIVVQRGFEPAYLERFRSISVDEKYVCAVAARNRQRIVVDDLHTHPDGAPLREMAAAGGYRSVQSTPLVSRNGNLLGVLSTHFRHAHRPSERDLRTLDLYAIQAIDQIERIRAEEALKEADRRKDEFIATLAHELRNPLAPIRNAIGMMQVAAEQGGLGRLQQMMERQVDHMVRLVDDLMEVSRITTGKIELRRGLVRLADALDNAVDTSMPHIDHARHRLSVSVAPEEMLLEGDPVRLEQVFANLLNNAAKYTEDGGCIWLSAWREGGVATIEVRDSGVGIPPDMLPHVFDIFAQAGDAEGRWQGGIGIGLYLVRRLVEMHGGSVDASSAGPGKGSRFVVRLPLVEGCIYQPDSGNSAAQAAPMRRKRVLIVDDNHDAAESLGMLLEHFGAETQVAHDGQAALQALDTSHPEVVLLDIGMPGMNGYEVARHIRQQPRFDGLLLIALSGWGGEEDRRRSKECGFDHHLVKPVDINALRSLLDAA